jgi:hypothetical protein
MRVLLRLQRLNFRVVWEQLLADRSELARAPVEVLAADNMTLADNRQHVAFKAQIDVDWLALTSESNTHSIASEAGLGRIDYVSALGNQCLLYSSNLRCRTLNPCPFFVLCQNLILGCTSIVRIARRLLDSACGYRRRGFDRVHILG